MSSLKRTLKAVATLALGQAILQTGFSPILVAQKTATDPAAAAASELSKAFLNEPSAIALPLPEDRGAAATEQALKRLSTTASVMAIVAHPDDEDGPLLTTLARGMGARVILFTLTRGEGGQNAMSADDDDALGILRTNELLKASEYYGVKQMFGTEADFGFSKTQEEAFSNWGHDRVLYDAVLAVRRERPLVIMSTFVGGITDGHGHHQVSGEIAQEVFKAAGDPAVFPDQLKAGLEPWQPLAVYSMVPFAPVTEKGMFDYATGKWAPAKFRNYVTGEWTNGVLSTDVTMPVGTWDPALGRSYVQIARQGWGEQKTQNGGANPALSGPASTSYHLWAVAPEAKAGGPHIASDGLFHNDKVQIDTGLAGLVRLAGATPPQWLSDALSAIQTELHGAVEAGQNNLAVAHKLAPIYRRTLALREKIAASTLPQTAKSSLLFEVDVKISQFQTALKDLLGLDLIAFTTRASKIEDGGFRGGSADEMPRSVSPGEEFNVRIHTTSSSPDATLTKSWFESETGDAWKAGEPLSTSGKGADNDSIVRLHVPANAEPTQPYFTRPTFAQPYYNTSNPDWRGRPFAPWPLAAWAEFSFDGLPIRVGGVVETLARVVGPGGIYEPLVVTPSIGVSIEPSARILPLDGSPLPVSVTVHTQAAAEGAVELTLPPGWHADPAQAAFHRDAAGDTEPLHFLVTPASVQTGAFSLQAVVHSTGRDYTSGWRSVGYPGLRPYNMYKPAKLDTRKIDLTLAPGLHVGYIMGPGDQVPEAIEGLGLTPHLLTSADLSSSDLSAWSVIVVGIRAYTTRPELAMNQGRLNEFVRRGGTLVVEYQSGPFPTPLPISLSRRPEEVVDEKAPVKILDPANALLSWPNKITVADFDGWVEERGHGFLDTWDPGFMALTETADAGQDPQRGGLLVAHPGKGTYIYCSFALHRQLPELVPGAYRLLANLLSAGKEPSK